MPNWCHNTLTIAGEAGELARFVEAAQPSEERLRFWWKQGRKAEFMPEKRTFKKYLADQRAKQPLSFDALLPQPSDEELRSLEVWGPCAMCGAKGTLPTSELDALLAGAKWFPWMDPNERDDRTCNVCRGTGEARKPGTEGWYTWRCQNWGCKWDASFDEPFIALGTHDADVELTVSTLGGTVTPTVVIYRFNTPWGPPNEFLEKASDLFPDLEFVLRYAEPGMGFAGEVKCVSGLTLLDEELEVDEVLAPEEMWF